MAENVEVILRLRGSRQFVSQATAAATSVDKVGKATDRAGKKADTASKSTGAFAGGMRKAFAFGAVGAGALAVGVGKAFNAYQESRKVAAQTGAVIKSTGGAAGVSAKQVGTMATALSKKSGMDDEAIQSGENLLLTFTNIRNQAGKGNDIFKQTTGIMTDMSAALGQDTKSSAMQLGKALNNPIKGVTALQRVGVAFTDQQKKQIKRLQESGHTLDAQKIILKELNTEFKGSAAAQATASDRMKVSWGNLMETMGGALAPFIDQGLRLLTKAFDALVPKIAGIVKAAVGFVNAFKDGNPVVIAFTVVIGALVVVLATYNAIMGAISLATKLWAGAQALLNAVMAANPIVLVIAVIVALVAAFILAYKRVGWFRAGVDAAFNGIKNAATAVVSWVKNAFNDVVGFFKGLPGKISRAVSGMFDGIKNAFKSAVNWVIGKWNALEFTIGGRKVFGHALPSVTIGTPDIPLLAKGGTVATGGTAIVGERGPEMVRLPPAAQVVPNSAFAPAGAGQGQTIVTQVFLDRRQIAEAIGTYTADRIARR